MVFNQTLRIDKKLKTLFGPMYITFRQMYDIPVDKDKTNLDNEPARVVLTGRFALTNKCPLKNICFDFYKNCYGSSMLYLSQDAPMGEFLTVQVYTNSGELLDTEMTPRVIGLIAEKLYEINATVEKHRVDVYFGMLSSQHIMIVSSIVWFINSVFAVIGRNKEPFHMLINLLIITSVLASVFILSLREYSNWRAQFGKIPDLDVTLI